MFAITESIDFTFDEYRRLRISVPAEYKPLAAWLHTDVQANGAALDHLVALLRRCQQEQRTLLGNGCSVDFAGDSVLLESLYGTWPRAVVPQALFWPVLDGLRGFLVNTSREPALARPPWYPAVTRATIEHRRPGDVVPSMVDHTYFPPDWSREQVTAAGEGAWQSAELIQDQATGVWSGLWHGLELAGYYDTATGQALGYFPVLSP